MPRSGRSCLRGASLSTLTSLPTAPMPMLPGDVTSEWAYGDGSGVVFGWRSSTPVSRRATRWWERCPSTSPSSGTPRNLTVCVSISARPTICTGTAPPAPASSANSRPRLSSCRFGYSVRTSRLGPGVRLRARVVHRQRGAGGQSVDVDLERRLGTGVLGTDRPRRPTPE